MVFDNADGSKFYFDEHTKSQKLNPKYLAGIKEYAVIKDLVCQSADKNRMVDTNLLNGLIDQVDLRCKILAIEIKAGDLEIDADEEKIYNDALYELARTEPKAIESQLAEGSQVLDTIGEQLNNISTNLDDFKSKVESSFEKMQKQIEKLVDS